MRFEIKNRSEFKVKFMLEVVRKGLSCFFKACCILVDGTGYKIAMSIAVEEQFISGDLPAYKNVIQALLWARPSSQINLVIPFSKTGNTESCFVCRQH